MNAVNTIRVLATSHCNLTCKHCYQHYDKNKYSLSFDTLCKIADFALQHDTETLILSGGEYFTHPNAYEFLSYCSKMPFNILIVSNGTLIDLDYFERAEFKDRLSIQLSIDGMESSHDSRRGQGTFRKTMECGSGLASLGIPVSISMALDADNYKDVIDVLGIPFAKEVKLLPVANVGAADHEIHAMMDDEYERAMQALLKSQSANPSPTNLFPLELAICYDGNVYPSMVAQDMGVLCLGNLFEKTLDDLTMRIQSEDPFSLATYLAEGCAICADRPSCDKCNRGCRERAYKAYGSLAAPDPLCCKLYNRAHVDIPIGNVFWGDIHPKIETERLLLRYWQYSDAEDLANGLNDEQTSYDYGTPYPYTRQDAFRFIDDAIRNSKPKFAIVLRHEHLIIGGCGIHQVGTNASANIWIASDYRKHGYAKEAGMALLIHGFDNLGIKRFTNSCFANNEASHRLQESVGSIEVTDTDSATNDGKRDRRYLTITKDDLARTSDSEG